MGIKFYKPTTPGRRQTSVDDFSDVTSKRSLKGRIVIKKNTGGRNNSGKVTVRHRGGDAKKFYRQVDFKQDKFNIPATLTAIEYDPNRSVRIGVLTYADGEKRYALLAEGLKIGQKVLSSKESIKPEVGNRMPLALIPVGMMVHNIELTPGKGGEIVRSAGGTAQLMAVENGFAHLKLPSGEVRMIAVECLATIGQLTGQYHRHIRIGKAGRSRHMGIRPSVRGKAMNPVDHPHGGGEGHNPIGLKHPKTPWGKPAYGVKTRKPGKYSDQLIVQRRKRKK